jgi:glycosyltransferase involved in cell wall biosynthesis
MTTKALDWAAVAWAPYSRRSEMFARELGGRLHCIHYLRFQSPRHAPFKYVLQGIHTLIVLVRERPRAVHVQTPPFCCGLVVLLYCAISGARFVTEYHSAAFEPIWRWAQPVQRLLARRAAMNIVTSEHWATLVRSWGGAALVMHDPFLDLPAGEPFPVAHGFTVAFAGTFAPDEPLNAVLEAASRLPDVHVYITGDTAKAPAGVLARAPANVTFTGFLHPNGEYVGLLRAVDAVMVLTTRDQTLQLAGCEAVAVGKPLITSDWPYLRDLFAAGAVFVAPTGESIRAGIADVIERHGELEREISAFREERQAEWAGRLARLRASVSETRHSQRRLEGGKGHEGLHHGRRRLHRRQLGRSPSPARR